MHSHFIRPLLSVEPIGAFAPKESAWSHDTMSRVAAW